LVGSWRRLFYEVFGEYNLNYTHCQMHDETTFKFQVALSFSKLWLDKVTATIVALRFLRVLFWATQISKLT